MARLVTLLCAFALAAAAAVPTTAGAAEWLAGDGHVHTCYSHDSWCPPDDDNTGPDTAYSSFAPVSERFAEASAKGLDYLVISDHNDVRAWDDPAFGSNGVLGVRAYEQSLPGGHAHVLGARRMYDLDDAQAVADAARADGALFQINHPTETGDADFATCDDMASGGDNIDWQYGFSIRPDTLEVWNATTLLGPAEQYWECWLQRGWRMPATAGSDSHGGNQANLGLPTLWAKADDRSEAAILRAMRDGRTTITRVPPSLGAARLLLEADADGDGTFEATMGDTVEPGTPMRVRADGLTAPATARVRANGATLVESRLDPGATLTFDAPDQPGWVRASLLGDQSTKSLDPNCRRSTPMPIDVCTADLTVLAMTSPVYLALPPAPAPEPTGKKPKKPKDAGNLLR